MTELAHTYIGNRHSDLGVAERVEQACVQGICLEVYLSQDDIIKGRIYTKSTSGQMVGIIKSRDWCLGEGDVFETEQGQLLIIHLKAQKVMVLSFTNEAKGREIELVHLGHVIGNHHWPIIVKDHKIYIQLVADLEVMEATVRSFDIPELSVTYESRSLNDQLTFAHSSTHQHS